ncbi:lamin tail domain-containing protein [Halopiger thermotolerans]
MNRRELLAASASGVAVGLCGCLETVRSRNQSAGTDGGLRVAGVYAADADREFIDGPYVVLENDADEPRNVSGYVLEYPADRRYRITDLTLEAGAQLAVVRGGGDDSTLLSSPPVYLRYAGGGTKGGAAGTALEPNGTVRVRDATGAVVAAARYEGFGCDGGTVTTGAGDDIECLHGASDRAPRRGSGSRER